jgi:hypothetical protein
MNVTITLDDELCREARHRAVDEGKSLSSWLAGLVRKEVRKASPAEATTLLDLLRDDAAGDIPLEIPELKDLPHPANLDA